MFLELVMIRAEILNFDSCFGERNKRRVIRQNRCSFLTKLIDQKQLEMMMAGDVITRRQRRMLVEAFSVGHRQIKDGYGLEP